MSFTTQQLHDEITLDPAGVGYASSVAVGADGAVAAALNLVRSTIQVNREPIAAAVFAALIDRGEFDAAAQGDRDYLAMLDAGGSVDVNNAVVYGALNALFTSAAWPNTRSRFAAILKRNGSRAEQLWGTGVAVGAGDVGVALRGA